LPPRIHQLKRLAELTSLNINESEIEFLRELSSYYIQSRYPEEVANLSAQVNRNETKRILDKTREMIQWLSSMQ
jgi:HEPN domain-containing protein